MTDALLNMGFTQHFPFVTFFSKGNIQVYTGYRPTSKEKIEDESNCYICNQVIVFDLPSKREFLFGKDDNAIEFIKSLKS